LTSYKGKSNKYTKILVNGDYSSLSATISKIEQWVQNGGTLGYQDAIKWLY
jgi:hypothetical protein